MVIQVSYSSARTNLSHLLDEVVNNHGLIIINRRNTKPIEMIGLSELKSLMETVHLLRSPKNALRLLNTIKRTQFHYRASHDRIDFLQCRYHY